MTLYDPDDLFGSEDNSEEESSLFSDGASDDSEEDSEMEEFILGNMLGWW